MKRPSLISARRLHSELTMLRTGLADLPDDPRLVEIDATIRTLGWVLEGHTPMRIMYLQQWAQTVNNSNNRRNLQ